MKPKKFLFWSPSPAIEEIFKKRGHKVTHNADSKYDCFVLTGFRSICPMLYGQSPLDTFNPKNMDISRDRREWTALRTLDFKKPKLGIGNGAHMLNVYSGGDMWQEVSGHVKPEDGHWVRLFDGTGVVMSSWHSQMMLPTKHAQIVGVSKNSTGKAKENMAVTSSTNNWDDPEIVYYRHTNSMCFQPIPGLRQYPLVDDVLFDMLEGSMF